VAPRSLDGRRPLLARAILAFLALPGVVAYVVPLLLAPRGGARRAWQVSGVILVVVGSFLLTLCVREFYVAGKGTLAPWSPPRHLVTSGPYGWSRNPMYVAVATVLGGWAVWFGSTTLLVYALAVVVAFHVRVLTYEEPRLAASFGERWAEYRSRVRRWI
jgi:protein-S-isoprenylcysteine O-methyltransferase Ste14